MHEIYEILKEYNICMSGGKVYNMADQDEESKKILGIAFWMRSKKLKREIKI